MEDNKPTDKQLTLATRIGIVNPHNYDKKALSRLIDQKLNPEEKPNDDKLDIIDAPVEKIKSTSTNDKIIRMCALKSAVEFGKEIPMGLIPTLEMADSFVVWINQ